MKHQKLAIKLLFFLLISFNLSLPAQPFQLSDDLETTGLANENDGVNTFENRHVLWPKNDALLISSRSNYKIPRAAESVTAADIDLDGDNDIVVGHDYNSQTHWSGVSYLLNNGNGTFYLNDSIYLYSWQTNIYAVNTNSDLYPEIIARHFENETQYMAVLEKFQVNYDTNLYSIPYGISGDNIGDINGDGYIDIIIYSSNDQFWGIMYNDGQGNFSQPEYHYVTNYFPSSVICGDLNGDNRDDIVVSGQSTEVYFSFPDGFQSLILETDGSMNISIIDFDLDGDNDILTSVGIPIVNFTSLKIHENQGSENFYNHEVLNFQPNCYKFSVTDFNNDSLADILFQLADHSGYIIYYNQGNFQLADSQFVALPPSNPQEARRNCYCADMDGNGYNDIIIVKTSHAPLPDNLSILFNDGHGNFVENPVTGIPQIEITPLKKLICYPNPFTTETTFEYRIKESVQAELSIYNLQGRLIKCIINKTQKGGQNNKIKWDGLDTGGKPCNPGPYFANLKINGEIRESVKLIKIN